MPCRSKPSRRHVILFPDSDDEGTGADDEHMQDERDDDAQQDNSDNDIMNSTWNAPEFRGFDADDAGHFFIILFRLLSDIIVFSRW